MKTRVAAALTVYLALTAASAWAAGHAGSVHATVFTVYGVLGDKYYSVLSSLYVAGLAAGAAATVLWAAGRRLAAAGAAAAWFLLVYRGYRAMIAALPGSGILFVVYEPAWPLILSVLALPLSLLPPVVLERLGRRRGQITQ